jgi:hypothetical protein
LRRHAAIRHGGGANSRRKEVRAWQPGAATTKVASPSGQMDAGRPASVTLDSGKRKFFYAKTRQDAARLLTIALRDRDNGRPIVGEKLTVAQYLTQWLKDIAPGLKRLLGGVEAEGAEGIPTTDMVRGGAAGKGTGPEEKREKRGRRERRATTASEAMRRDQIAG